MLKATKALLDRYIAYVYLHGLDKAKYGLMLKGLRSQYSLSHDQYPKGLEEAINVVGAHRWDPEYKHKQQRRNKPFNKGNNTNQEPDKKQSYELSFAQ